MIAIPLLEQINAELRTSDEFRARHPELNDTRNAAVILLAPPERATKAYEELLALMKKAERYVEERTGATPGKSKHGSKRTHVKKKAAAPAENILDPPQTIGSHAACLAKLEGRVIRVMLLMDHDSNEPLIEHLADQHDVIIDINLDFKPRERVLKLMRRATGVATDPDVRLIAKVLIDRYVELAKQQEAVTDPHQAVDKRTSSTSEQYVFARLEGKVISHLVELDDQMARAFAWLEPAEAIREGEPWAEKLAPDHGDLQVEKFFATIEPGDAWLDHVLKAGAELQRLMPTPKLQVGRFRTIHHIWPDFDIYTCDSYSSLATVKADAAQRAFAAAGEEITWAVIDTGIQGD